MRTDELSVPAFHLGAQLPRVLRAHEDAWLRTAPLESPDFTDQLEELAGLSKKCNLLAIDKRSRGLRKKWEAALKGAQNEWGDTALGLLRLLDKGDLSVIGAVSFVTAPVLKKLRIRASRDDIEKYLRLTLEQGGATHKQVDLFGEELPPDAVPPLLDQSCGMAWTRLSVLTARLVSAWCVQGKRTKETREAIEGALSRAFEKVNARLATEQRVVSLDEQAGKFLGRGRDDHPVERLRASPVLDELKVTVRETVDAGVSLGEPAGVWFLLGLRLGVLEFRAVYSPLCEWINGPDLELIPGSGEVVGYRHLVDLIRLDTERLEVAVEAPAFAMGSRFEPAEWSRRLQRIINGECLLVPQGETQLQRAQPGGIIGTGDCRVTVRRGKYVGVEDFDAGTPPGVTTPKSVLTVKVEQPGQSPKLYKLRGGEVTSLLVGVLRKEHEASVSGRAFCERDIHLFEVQRSRTRQRLAKKLKEEEWPFSVRRFPPEAERGGRTHPIKAIQLVWPNLPPEIRVELLLLT